MGKEYINSKYHTPILVCAVLAVFYPILGNDDGTKIDCLRVYDGSGGALCITLSCKKK